MTATTQTRDELELDPLDRFVALAITGDAGASVTRTRLSGGLSQTTLVYRVEDAPDGVDPRLVVRIPPLTGPLEPYDSATEAAVMMAVAERGIPTPEVVVVEATGDVIGRPFYATRFVTAAMSSEGSFGPDARVDRMAEAYVDQLAALRKLDIHEGGSDGPSLAALLRGAPEKTAPAVLDRWSTAFARRALREPAYQHFLFAWLQARMPEDDGVRSLVHGDYRLGNMLWKAPGEIVATMDWEEAGIGDPYFDLGWTLLGAHEDEDNVLGLASRRWILDRYAASTGAELDRRRLLWWEVAAAWVLLRTNALGVSAACRGASSDMRTLLYCYLDRRIASGALRKVEAYEKAGP